MSNWHPKPIRPHESNPIFVEDKSFTIKKSSELTPIQRQRMLDGTQHTRGSQYRIPVGSQPQVSGPMLYLGPPVEKSQTAGKTSLDPDAVVKSFLAKGYEPEEAEEETEKAGMGAKMGAAAGKVAQTAGSVAGKVARTAVGLASQN